MNKNRYQYIPLHLRIINTDVNQRPMSMRILSIYIICILMMQGAMFAAPQYGTSIMSQCSCCENASQKCRCCSTEVPANGARTSWKNVLLGSSPCNCSLPAAPKRHETAAVISGNSGSEHVRFISTMPAVMTWQGFNYLRNSTAAIPPPPISLGAPPLSFPLRI
jgi:hypothetical protein